MPEFSGKNSKLFPDCARLSFSHPGLGFHSDLIHRSQIKAIFVFFVLGVGFETGLEFSLKNRL
jgi:hypothetical protein